MKRLLFIWFGLLNRRCHATSPPSVDSPKYIFTEKDADAYINSGLHPGPSDAPFEYAAYLTKSTVLSDSDGFESVKMGMDFHVGGVNSAVGHTAFSSVYISSNGFVAFGDGFVGGMDSNRSLPTDEFLGPIIAPLWNALDTAACGSVYHGQVTIDGYSGKAFMVAWDHVCQYTGSLQTDLSFDIELILFDDGSWMTYIRYHVPTRSSHRNYFYDPTIGYQFSPTDGGMFCEHCSIYDFRYLRPGKFAFLIEASIGYGTGSSSSNGESAPRNGGFKYPQVPGRPSGSSSTSTTSSPSSSSTPSDSVQQEQIHHKGHSSRGHMSTLIVGLIIGLSAIFIAILCIISSPKLKEWCCGIKPFPPSSANERPGSRRLPTVLPLSAFSIPEVMAMMSPFGTAAASESSETSGEEADRHVCMVAPSSASIKAAATAWSCDVSFLPIADAVAIEMLKPHAQPTRVSDEMV